MKYLYMSVIAPAFVLVPVSAALIRYRALTRAMRVLFGYLVLTAVVNAVSTLLAENGHSNLEIFHVYTIVESVLLLQFFYLTFRQRRPKRLTRLLMIAFPLLCCLNFIFIQSISGFNTYTRPVECVLFMALCLAYWWQAGDAETGGSWTAVPVNWVLSGLLLYFSSAFFLFIFTNFMFTQYSRAVNETIWNIHATLVAIMYLLFAIGFSKCNR
ncbi:MAG: hypothetical protein ABW019_16915 [Chitinophagaceae bacterium]